MTRIEVLSAEQLEADFAAFVELLRDAVDDGASIGFHRPLATEEAEAYWHDIAADVAKGKRLLLAAYEGERLTGSVQLELVGKPNGRHRAEVQKLMVHTAWRGKGIGKVLLRALDDCARAHGRTLLVLDTLKGDVAEGMYERYGYVRVGEIPDFVVNEKGVLEATVYFYRILNPSEAE